MICSSRGVALAMGQRSLDSIRAPHAALVQQCRCCGPQPQGPLGTLATSRARCVSVVVANPELFAADAKAPRQMRLANAFCRFLSNGPGGALPDIADADLGAGVPFGQNPQISPSSWSRLSSIGNRNLWCVRCL